MIKYIKKIINHSSIRINCLKYGIGNYIINDDLTIDIDGSISLGEWSPLKFNRVDEEFYCEGKNITNLEGCPKEVGGRFNCGFNRLTSLKGCPKYVGGSFDCSYNQLESLEGMPSMVGGSIFCKNNNIKSFKGIPEDFNGLIFYENNPIYEIYKVFGYNSKCIYWLNEYDVIRGSDIIMDRLEEVFHQLDIEIPYIKEIEGYNLI